MGKPSKPVLYAGKVVGKWTLVSQTRRYWECRCVCGAVRSVSKGNLKSGGSLGCFDCSRSVSSTLLEPGTLWGKWLILGSCKDSKARRVMAVCTKCGREKSVLENSIRSGRSTQCSTCGNREKAQGLRKTLAQRAAATKYNSYRNGAFDRDISWSLSFDDFAALIFRNCHYCGSPPETIYTVKDERGHVAHSGVDRVDNNVGYTVDNCVPCCRFCNIAKGTYDVHTFVARCYRVVNKAIEGGYFL